MFDIIYSLAPSILKAYGLEGLIGLDQSSFYLLWEEKIRSLSNETSQSTLFLADTAAIRYVFAVTSICRSGLVATAV